MLIPATDDIIRINDNCYKLKDWEQMDYAKSTKRGEKFLTICMLEIETAYFARIGPTCTLAAVIDGIHNSYCHRDEHSKCPIKTVYLTRSIHHTEGFCGYNEPIWPYVEHGQILFQTYTQALNEHNLYVWRRSYLYSIMDHCQLCDSKINLCIIESDVVMVTLCKNCIASRLKNGQIICECQSNDISIKTTYTEEKLPILHVKCKNQDCGYHFTCPYCKIPICRGILCKCEKFYYCSDTCLQKDDHSSQCKLYKELLPSQRTITKQGNIHVFSDWEIESKAFRITGKLVYIKFLNLITVITDLQVNDKLIDVKVKLITRLQRENPRADGNNSLNYNLLTNLTLIIDDGQTSLGADSDPVYDKLVMGQFLFVHQIYYKFYPIFTDEYASCSCYGVQLKAVEQERCGLFAICELCKDVPRHCIRCRRVTKNLIIRENNLAYAKCTKTKDCKPSRCNYCSLVLGQHFKCGHCRIIYYCSKDCQRKDWAIHKKSCVPVIKAQADK